MLVNGTVSQELTEQTTTAVLSNVQRRQIVDHFMADLDLSVTKRSQSRNRAEKDTIWPYIRAHVVRQAAWQMAA
jgi:hypothetical protein